ncbi:MAG: DUF3373 family protein [Nitrospiraceae bacterium]|nr:DUF3373 family protein [Nitrospiraceae bacterium]
MKKFFVFFLAVLLLLPATVFAEQKVASWLTIGGDYQARYDYLYGRSASYFNLADEAAFFNNYFSTGTPDPSLAAAARASQRYKQDSLITNRFGLNFAAKPVRFVNFKARLSMYQVAGSNSENAVAQNMFFMDRAGTWGGVQGHVPASNYVNVDYAYFTWFNIDDTPTWFSFGRRPSTDGIPGNLRENVIHTGTGGTPNLLVNYVFDGFSLGWAPYIEQLPGFFIKACGGQGFNAGYSNLNNTDFVGLFIAPYQTSNLQIVLQWDRGINIFDAPPDFQVPTTDTSNVQEFLNPTTNVGNIDWYGAVAEGKTHNLNYFVAGALSHAMPNGNKAGAFAPFIKQNLGFVDSNTGFPLQDSALTAAQLAEVKALEPEMLDGSNHTGWAVYVGARYDIPTWRTKIGAEFNHGSKDWIGFEPANQDMWTSKLGTRGDVYEVYAIQELHNTPIDKVGLAFIRLGYQYYDVKYTGSNNWLGGPVAMNDLTSSVMNSQIFAPIRSAQDVYLTFNVKF